MFIKKHETRKGLTTMSRKLQIKLYSVTVAICKDSPTVYTVDQGTVSEA